MIQTFLLLTGLHSGRCLGPEDRVLQRGLARRTAGPRAAPAQNRSGP